MTEEERLAGGIFQTVVIFVSPHIRYTALIGNVSVGDNDECHLTGFSAGEKDVAPEMCWVLPAHGTGNFLFTNSLIEDKADK